MVGYSAECIKCGVVFRKRTNKGKAICDDCINRKIKKKICIINQKYYLIDR